MYLAFCSIVIIFNIRLSSVCLMMINVFDRKLTFYFLNTSDGFLRLRPQIHTLIYIKCVYEINVLYVHCTLYKVHFTAYTLHDVYLRNKPFIYFLVTL